jgi:hypothetical protein
MGMITTMIMITIIIIHMNRGTSNSERRTPNTERRTCSAPSTLRLLTPTLSSFGEERETDHVVLRMMGTGIIITIMTTIMAKAIRMIIRCSMTNLGGTWTFISPFSTRTIGRRNAIAASFRRAVYWS